MKVSPLALVFPAPGNRTTVLQFNGGDVTSDAGLALIAQADRKLGVTAALAAATRDLRQQAKVDHSASEIITARIYAIAMGYEDGNDFDRLRDDPALKAVCGQLPASGNALMSQPTLSRFENALTRTDIYRMAWKLVDIVIAQLLTDTNEVVIDVDPYDDPCYGQQQLSLFNRHYDTRCYLPLAVCISGNDGVKRALGALLRPGTAKATLGLHGILRELVKRLRVRFPDLRIILRADSAYGNADVLRWCDSLGLVPLLGIGRNRALQRKGTSIQMQACLRYAREGDGCREFGEFKHAARTWDRKRRIILKAEITNGELNPRYIISGLGGTPEEDYERYCGRGDAENVWKEFKIDMSAGRTSCSTFIANQARLIWHAAALILCAAIRNAATGTKWEKSTVGTLRTRLFKIGAKIVETCRKIWWHLPTSCPVQTDWALIFNRLC